MTIVFQGDIDLVNEKMDLIVLVAPLKTVDYVIRQIPLIGKILRTTLTSIPVKLTGDLKDPSVVPLSPSAIGSETLNLLKRKVQVPFSIIQPLLPNTQR
jgi:hypothetical protein